MLTLIASAGWWQLGIALGIVVIAVAAVIVIVIVSGVRILHAARSLRKVAVGK